MTQLNTHHAARLDPAGPDEPVCPPESQDERSLRIDTEQWGRSWVEVDLGALRRNVARVARQLPTDSRLIVSAKKDAYGHGLLAVAHMMSELPPIAGFGVATLEEGLALRRSGITLPIIIFCVLEGEALAEAIRQQITLTITNLSEAQAANRLAAVLQQPALAHLKLDTGMGRLGRFPGEIEAQIPEIRQLSNLRLHGLYSHLADAWDDPADARRQWLRMEDFRARTGLESLLCHWGGSDALALDPAASPIQCLRSGVALYGDHPAVADLEPVMTFKTRVVFRRAVPAQTAISYGHTFRTSRPTELALIGAGYGNGLLRALSGRGSILIRGRRCPILGRVCMDQVAVDVTEIPEVALGEEAVIFGRQGEAVLPAAEQASQAGTISYELFCLAGQLNPRFFVHSER